MRGRWCFVERSGSALAHHWARPPSGVGAGPQTSWIVTPPEWSITDHRKRARETMRTENSLEGQQNEAFRVGIATLRECLTRRSNQRIARSTDGATFALFAAMRNSLLLVVALAS